MVEHSGFGEEEQIQQLVLRSQKGDDTAFGAIYDLFAEPVYKFIYVRIRHRETAEDLLSESFLKCWKNIHRYNRQPASKFSTWLFQITHNTIRDFWRKNKNELPLEEQRFIIDDVPSLHSELDTSLRIEATMKKLADLPESYQTVLILRFINQLSIEETSQIMKKSNGAVRVLQSRALRLLRETFT